jgi:hypothetical protein
MLMEASRLRIQLVARREAGKLSLSFLSGCVNGQ